MPQISIDGENERVAHDMAGSGDPCVGCGCCCKFFRVSFYHGELDTQPGGYVPAALTTAITPFRVCMKGTESGEGRCISLQADNRCSIYEKRPSVCREFPALLEDGSLNPECVRLKRLFSLPVPGEPPGLAGDDAQRAV